MTVKELIEKLQTFDGSLEVTMLNDEFNAYWEITEVKLLEGYKGITPSSKSSFVGIE
jgi:hypothetical protein